MANTWSFFPDGATLIKAALRRVRAYDPEDATTISTVQYNNALETLNFIMGAWQALGLQIWCRKQASKALTLSTASYTVGTGANINILRPLVIYQAWLTDLNNVDTPLNIIGEQEYYQLSTKTQDGRPISIYYNPAYDGSTNQGSTSTGTLYIWPRADSNAVTNYTLKFLYQRPLEDFDATTDKIDMPQEWFNALRLNLALAIAPEYGLPIIEYDRLKKEAEEALELAKSWDVEHAVSVKFQPNNDQGRSGY